MRDKPLLLGIEFISLRQPARCAAEFPPADQSGQNREKQPLLRIVQLAAHFFGFVGQCAGNALHLRIGLQEIFRLVLFVSPPDTVQRHLHQSEIACPLRDVKLNCLDQRFDGRLILEANQGERNFRLRTFVTGWSSEMTMVSVIANQSALITTQSVRCFDRAFRHPFERSA
jgi:hypothetical protein